MIDILEKLDLIELDRIGVQLSMDLQRGGYIPAPPAN